MPALLCLCVINLLKHTQIFEPAFIPQENEATSVFDLFGGLLKTLDKSRRFEIGCFSKQMNP